MNPNEQLKREQKVTTELLGLETFYIQAGLSLNDPATYEKMRRAVRACPEAYSPETHRALLGRIELILKSRWAAERSVA